MKNLPVVLQKINKEDKELIKNLLQFYLYDYSETDKRDINKWGVFEYEYLDAYFDEDENREAFFIKLNDIVVGFLLINKNINIKSITEFFVMKKYRRIGIGTATLKKVFEKYSGEWEIKIDKNNDLGLNFWRKNINNITKGKYFETSVEKGEEKYYVEKFKI